MLLTTQPGKSGVFEDGKLKFLLAEIGSDGVKNGLNEQIEQNFLKKRENLEKNTCKNR